MKAGSTFVGLNGYIVVSHIDQARVSLVFRVKNRRHCQINLHLGYPHSVLNGLRAIDDELPVMRLPHERRFWFYAKLYSWLQDVGALTNGGE